jgi:ATP-dependent Lhr-like helicase
MTNIGVIADEARVDVKLIDFYIGSLDELFVERLRKGDVFVLGGQAYEFRYLRGLKATVKTALGRPPTVPAWYSEMLPLSFDLANNIIDFRTIMKDFLQNKTEKKKIIEFLKDYLHESDDSVLKIIYEYFLTQYEFDSRLPVKDYLSIERFEDHDVHYVFNSLYGRKVNDVFATLLGYIISKEIHRDVELSVTDNGFMISSDIRFNLEKALNDLMLLDEKQIDIVLSKAIESSILFNNRFRHNAVRSLMILRNYKGKLKSVGRQNIAAKFLIKAVESVDHDFPVLKETRREIFYDVMDLDNAKKIFKLLKSKR